MGPCIVTADAMDHTNLDVECRVSGVVKQSSNTRHLYFKVPRLIAELSLGMTLEAGDIISTGTPEGVGFARKPPEWMIDGDLLETEIQGIGILRNPIGHL
jgi:2-keto-4-pentenoate hydratase/2-oxohepta-3-ene-1,7-dioic acid hydratase in catechol pathway